MIAILIGVFSQAEYTIKIPIETNNINMQLENWIPTNPVIGEWENIGNIYDCNNWSPLASDITAGQSFIQTATDCQQSQSRNYQEREIDESSGNIRNVGESLTQTQIITTIDTRNMIGMKESWVAIDPLYTEWVNNGSVSNCNNWAPDAATYDAGVEFNQTATDCQQEQISYRQNREQESTTQDIRNVGVPIAETKTINVSSTRTSVGTKEVCQYKKTSMTPVLYNGVVNDSSTNHVFYWNGKTLGNAKTTTLNSGGFTYRASTLMETISDDGVKIKYYKICKK